jgi:beta-glucosidase
MSSGFGPDSRITVSTSLKNEGQVAGSEVVQIYVSYPDDLGLTTPANQLRGFKKARDVAPGASQRLDIILDKYAFSLWDELRSAWRVSAGRYLIRAGFSSDALTLSTSVEISETFYWNGL